MRTPFVVVGTSLVDHGAVALVALRPDQEHHLRRVLRRADGDPVVITDGAGRTADGTLTAGGVRVTSEVMTVPAPVPALTVVHALPKGRAMDDVVRALVEVGAAGIEPVLTARTESRPRGDKARAVTERLQSVAVSAAEQARSAHLCQIGRLRRLDMTQREGAPTDLCLIAHPAASRTLGEAIPIGLAHGAGRAVRVLIGPEGGLTEAEVEGLEDAGWSAVRVGDSVLRTVHAGVVVAAAILALTGRYGNPPASNAL